MVVVVRNLQTSGLPEQPEHGTEARGSWGGPFSPGPVLTRAKTQIHQWDHLQTLAFLHFVSFLIIFFLARSFRIFLGFKRLLHYKLPEDLIFWTQRRRKGHFEDGILKLPNASSLQLMILKLLLGIQNLWCVRTQDLIKQNVYRWASCSTKKWGLFKLQFHIWGRYRLTFISYLQHWPLS